MNKISGVEEITPVMIYEESEYLSAKKIISGYDPIKYVKVVSDTFFDLFGGGTSQAEESAFSILENYIIDNGWNVAVVTSRHLSGIIDKQLELSAKVYNISSLSN